MSIVRWGQNGSNVYIIGIHDDLWQCVGCDGPDAVSKMDQFLKHLNWHRERGDIVPAYVEVRLKEYQ